MTELSGNSEPLTPPQIRLIGASEAFAERVKGLVPDFVVQPSELPEHFHLPADALHIWMIEIPIVEQFLNVIHNAGGDPALLLQSAMVFSRNSLSDRQRLDLFEKGFAFIYAEGDSVDLLQQRLSTLLQTRSRILTERILGKRLRSRLELQRSQIENHQNFLYMAVHDLRGPLAAMICYAELLMEGVLGNLQQSQLEPIRTIHRSCQFMIDMVTDLLDSAKIEAGKLTLQLEKGSFQHEVETTVQSLKGLADTKNIRIEVEAEALPEMFLDTQKVSRILANLLGNAIKFTKTGGRIILRTGQQGNTLVFSIQDTGPGIAAADIEAIFEKFNTGEGSQVQGKGHGLGLAISRSFVELHGGRMFVESTRHKGSVFIVHLPIEKRQHSARRQTTRKVLILDLTRDLPGLEQLGDRPSEASLTFAYISSTAKDWSLQQLPPFDFLLINEPDDLGVLGHDYHLLALGTLSPEARCALLISSKMPEEEKETRRLLGFTLLEKPCTADQLFDTLQAIFGHDRRQRSA